MKLNITILIFVLVILLMGCNKGQLTKEGAKCVLEEWQLDAVPGQRISNDTVTTSGGNSESNLVIQGIQELPQGNSAEVSVVFNNFEYDREASPYSGSGTATFTKYNDGKWVLTKVETPVKTWDSSQVGNRVVDDCDPNEVNIRIR